MTTLTSMDSETLRSRHDAVRAEYEAFKARGLKLDMTRGKPSPEQLDLSNAMLTLPGNGDYFAEGNVDARNYGGLNGLPETRRLFSQMIQAPADQIVVGDNSSLALMHGTIVSALLKGVPDSNAPWSEGAPTFLCPVPGYDRHFAICEELGIRMIPVPMTGEGPDMDMVERLVEDHAVKGIWCVPKYSNPSGETYSLETSRRLAAMKTAAPDFRIFWDNAYSVHHLTKDHHTIPDILALCAEAGNPNRAFIFASTSKVTLPGAGLAFFASSPENVRWYLERAFFRTIGPDKLNQLRHVRFLKDHAGLEAHMEKQAQIVAPKFEALLQILEAKLGGTGAAEWLRPAGGYFVTLNAVEGTAKRIVSLAKEAGIALTPAGATSPYGQDQHDRTLRLAPTFPSLSDVKAAAEGIAICTLLAAIEKQAGIHG
ncbi:aminotransferase class I/II-fold pyridoxal phosphate-dependent enzyme [Methylobacterium gnaphalii]|uniref:Aminotransferase n=1 Tax=Methylobacterium gnaphalii TaxID=1010610 RepID=A0A512JH43_9HYPH|nr:aminotransferase class I/II-fold pyridoxal phosphate-dependent enzyme [Methylobacterium gnaphalii]GEP09246.1 aminotransferase [Methylobacterium gnaphalii]GJD69026.1 Putative aminotransferase/MSMEI_6121 [Methylobacterium gnaphalii]GLS49238.1 aminotransferase [Methylobacterium gnaphalii]